MPFLWLSSSSSVIRGKNTSCSSKRNNDVGSCINTLVSRTKIFLPVSETWRLLFAIGVAAGLRALLDAAAGILRVRLVSGAFAVTVLSAAKVKGALPVAGLLSETSVFLVGFFGLGAVIGGISFSVVAGLLGSLGSGIVNDLK